MVAVQRLANQHLADPILTAESLVTAMGAIQAQEYWGGLWAVGLRTRGTDEASIEASLARGSILRTHPMRGTHHLVARADIRWLIDLMGPLMIRRNERRNRELDLDEKTLRKALTAIERALAGGTHLARAETADVLRRAKIAPDGQRIAHIIYRAELEGLVCSGARKGKQVTIALLSERAPDAKPKSREASLKELATRYFTTRGPATRADFAWWCQLPAADVREAMELATLDTDGTYFTKNPHKAKPKHRAYLLPPYDEYSVGYIDRSHAGTQLLKPSVLVDGRVVGTWRRAKKGVELSLTAKADRAVLDEAIARFVAYSRQPPPSAR